MGFPFVAEKSEPCSVILSRLRFSDVQSKCIQIVIEFQRMFLHFVFLQGKIQWQQIGIPDKEQCFIESWTIDAFHIHAIPNTAEGTLTWNSPSDPGCMLLAGRGHTTVFRVPRGSRNIPAQPRANTGGGHSMKQLRKRSNCTPVITTDGQPARDCLMQQLHPGGVHVVNASCGWNHRFVRWSRESLVACTHSNSRTNESNDRCVMEFSAGASNHSIKRE